MGKTRTTKKEPHDRCGFDLPHPSLANSERIAYFMGGKARAALSAKTNPVKLDATKSALIATFERHNCGAKI
ncbi:MAG: hypothetical protein Q8L50_07565 [Polaromonas sp.]|nr:hypothetical protein [Polaromonas sp.]